MTTVADRPAPAPLPRSDAPTAPSRRAWWLAHAVPLTVLTTVLLRLIDLTRPPASDEAGYLVVAGQWAAHGSSLYGDQWVDRPPVLVTLYRLAALAGGVVPLRILGILAAALTVVGVARIAGRLACDEGSGLAGASIRASAWAAVVAAAWCVSPLSGSVEVDGELLAAPFVVWGIAGVHAAMDATRTAGRPTARASALAAAGGMLGTAAVLVKQNFVDVAVFALALGLAALCRRHVGRRSVAGLALSWGGGALSALLVVAIWTWWHGTSLRGVFYAMYPFRVDAGRVLAAYGQSAATGRLLSLGIAFVLSGMALVAALAVMSLVRDRGMRSDTVIALVTVLAFDGVSIALGGGYWLHYLVQLVAPLAVLCGLLMARHPRRAVPVVATVVLSAVLALTGSRVTSFGPSTTGASVGRAIGAVSMADDTIVTLYGHSEVTQQSGLTSPYPYLWALPAKTLDPDLETLASVLAGPDAPTWVVTWRHLATPGVRSGEATRVLTDRYHPAAVLDGHTIYLRDGLDRASPVLG